MYAYILIFIHTHIHTGSIQHRRGAVFLFINGSLNVILCVFGKAAFNGMYVCMYACVHVYCRVFGRKVLACMHVCMYVCLYICQLHSSSVCKQVLDGMHACMYVGCLCVCV